MSKLPTEKELEELLAKLQSLEEENKFLKSRKKFGLVFEEKPEFTLMKTKFENIYYYDKKLFQCIRNEEDLTKEEKATLSKNIYDKEKSLYKINDELFLLKEKKFFKYVDNANYIPAFEVDEEKSFYDENSNVCNYLIEGDNLESLQILSTTHAGKIDVIYIDPPYNTGSKDFKYNDAFVDKEDSFRHSKWLSFMSKRLELAKDLLTESGVMFLSIDDNEQHRLRMLCEEIFSENNIEIMVWEKVGDGNAAAGKMKTTHRFRVEHEYIIVCYKNKELSKFNKTFEKPSFENEYKNLDNDPRGSFKSGNISKTEDKSIATGKNFYTVISPDGVNRYSRQWHFSQDEFNRLNEDGRIYWGKTGNGVPQLKIFINEERETTPTSILIKKGSMSMGLAELSQIIEKEKIKDFTPKPIKLLKHLLHISASKNAIVLDFFAGSGTTGHAIQELNAEDGGNRQYILCTNNENNICEEITYQRLARINNPQAFNLDTKKVKQLKHSLKYIRTVAVSSSIYDEVSQNIKDILFFKEDVYKQNDYENSLENENKRVHVFFADEDIENIIETINESIKDDIQLVVYFEGSKGAKELIKKYGVEVEIHEIPEQLLKRLEGVRK